MAETKTRPETTSVESFIASAEPARQQEGRQLLALFKKVTRQPAVMWGPSIVGFGSYRYQSASGHEGTMCRIGFSPRKANLSIYLLDGFEGREAELARLGPHKLGKSCLYLKSLAGVDMKALEALLRDSWRVMNERHPDG